MRVQGSKKCHATHAKEIFFKKAFSTILRLRVSATLCNVLMAAFSLCF